MALFHRFAFVCPNCQTRQPAEQCHPEQDHAQDGERHALRQKGSHQRPGQNTHESEHLHGPRAIGNPLFTPDVTNQPVLRRRKQRTL